MSTINTNESTQADFTYPESKQQEEKDQQYPDAKDQSAEDQEEKEEESPEPTLSEEERQTRELWFLVKKSKKKTEYSDRTIIKITKFYRVTDLNRIFLREDILVDIETIYKYH